MRGFGCHFQYSSSVNQLTDPLWKRFRIKDKEKKYQVYVSNRKKSKQRGGRGSWRKNKKILKKRERQRCSTEEPKLEEGEVDSIDVGTFEGSKNVGLF